MYQLPCIHGIEQVYVAWHARENLERELAATHGAERRRQLVWVATVLQRAVHLEGHSPRRRLLLNVVHHPRAHHRVVRRGQGVRCAGTVLAERHRCGAIIRLHVLHERAILRRARDDGNEGVVLGGRADHARATDVHVLNACGKVAGVLGHGLVEGIEVHDGQINWPDAVLDHLGLMLRIAPGSEQPTMDLRVQGLHAAIQDFGRASVISNILHCAANLPQLRRSAACGEHVHIVGRQELAQLLDTRLVKDGHQGSPDLDLVLHLATHGRDGGSAHGSEGRRRGRGGGDVRRPF
mmetsp:Transcript_96186/g.248730  ORF Transcript_96186/g.248730 Transcript_96186/m.248730 type:complete len:294 (+) Transcript_96186:592-1473(+)